MTTAVREFEGKTLPRAGVWHIDPAHSRVGFAVRHLGLSKVRGEFKDFNAEIVVGERPEDSRVSAEVDASSIDTREEQRDGHLRSADFLDVENYPTMTFESTQVRHSGGDDWEIDGNLTIRGTTRPITLNVTFEGAAPDPTQGGAEKAVISGSTRVNREDFGLTWNMALETGGWLVGKDVDVDIEVEALRSE